MANKEENVPIKKRKIDNIDGLEDKSHPVLESFDGLSVEKILAENSRCKTVTVHAKLNGEDVVVLLEKKPFDQANVQNLISSKTTMKNTLKNDIYGTYEAYPPPIENAIKAVVIHPATEKHLSKYAEQERFVIRETATLYSSVTLPHLEVKQFSIQWVYNILDKKQEADRIVFEDTDPETGFILLPDMKWDRQDINALYLVAIVHSHGIKSLRDLNQLSLPLLRNILQKGLEAIMDTYGVPASQLHVYIHYQPSYYHLHVHFTHIKLEAPGFGADRAHLFSDVIENIEQMSDYYKKKTLTYTVRSGDDLYKAYRNSGYFDKDKPQLQSESSN